MKETITRDDLTHDVIDPGRAVSVEIMVGTRIGTFEATEESQAAIAAMLFDHDPSKVKALLGIAPPKPANPAMPNGKAPRNRNGDGESAMARQWCRTPDGKAAVDRLGIAMPEKGRMPKQLIQAWREATK